MNSPLWLGLDIGGTKLAAGVVTADGAVSGTLVIATEKQRGVDDVLARLMQLGHDAVSAAGVTLDDLTGVGIGCGGPLDPRSGRIYSPPNLPGWDDVDIVGAVSQAFGLPAFLGNDADVAALAEFTFGGHVAASSLVYLTISTGCGGGTIIEGRPWLGATASASEFGHMVIDRAGRSCPCGSRGCLEAYVSGPSIAARAAEALARDSDSSLSSVSVLRAEHVVEAAAAGDRVATLVWAETTSALGTGLLTIANTIDPEVIVLGGGVTRAGSALLGPTLKAMQGGQLKRPGVAPTPVVLSALGDEVGIVGAATLARIMMEDA